MEDQRGDFAGLRGLVGGRHALVTGAGGGIGRSIANAFEQAGGKVARLDSRPGDGILVCDVTDEEATASTFDQIAAADPLTDIIHAAGIVQIGAVAETSVESFRHVIEVNLIGSFIVARQATRLPRGGNLIFIASQAGLKGGALWSAYSASKGGVLRLADCLVEELSMQGVRVNSISPGSVETPMTLSAIDEIASRSGQSAGDVRMRYLRSIPMQRFALPDEIARAAVVLCSGLLSYMNGANLVIDGGEMTR